MKHQGNVKEAGLEGRNNLTYWWRKTDTGSGTGAGTSYI